MSDNIIKIDQLHSIYIQEIVSIELIKNSYGDWVEIETNDGNIYQNDDPALFELVKNHKDAIPGLIYKVVE